MPDSAGRPLRQHSSDGHSRIEKDRDHRDGTEPYSVRRLHVPRGSAVPNTLMVIIVLPPAVIRSPSHTRISPGHRNSRTRQQQQLLA